MSHNQLKELLKFVQDGGRICPQPGKWNELWEMLPDRQRIGSGWQPPLPLILAAWDHSTGIEKMLRLREHIEYAEAKGVLSQVDRYLRDLPASEWYMGK